MSIEVKGPTLGESVSEATIAKWFKNVGDAVNADEPPAYDALMDQIEASVLRHLLSCYDNKPTHLAGALRMNRATLRQKLRRAGLQRDEDG